MAAPDSGSGPRCSSTSVCRPAIRSCADWSDRPCSISPDERCTSRDRIAHWLYASAASARPGCVRAVTCPARYRRSADAGLSRHSARGGGLPLRSPSRSHTCVPACIHSLTELIELHQDGAAGTAASVVSRGEATKTTAPSWLEPQSGSTSRGCARRNDSGRSGPAHTARIILPDRRLETRFGQNAVPVTRALRAGRIP